MTNKEKTVYLVFHRGGQCCFVFSLILCWVIRILVAVGWRSLI